MEYIRLKNKRNMSFEEFRVPAINPTYPECKTFYRIDVHGLKNKWQAESSPNEFEMVKAQSFIYPDVDTAQFMIRK